MAVRALSTAASGMKAMQTHVDVIANNLANVQTVGYKRDRAEFNDLLYQQMRRPGLLTPLQNRTPVGIQIGNGVRVSAVAKEFEQGAPRYTGNELDMAINGPGFFQVQIQEGQIAYTRDGTFHRDSEGNVVTAEGYFLQPQITLPDNAVRLEVSRDGRLQAWDNENNDIGEFQIELAYVPNPQGLEAIGDNLYVADVDATGNIQTGNPATAGFGTLMGRFLETSNVDVVTSMTELIKAQRAYEFNANAIRSSDTMLQTASAMGR